MAENVVLQNVSTLQNSSIVAAINANNGTITTAFADCLSLTGTSPNSMLANLDMNNFQIINLPAPATLNSPIRLIDLEQAILGASSSIFGLIGANNVWTGINTFANTTQSSSTTTGSVIIGGGLGVAKNLNVGGTLNVGTVVGSGITTITINGLGGTFPTTGSDGIILQNTTAATLGVPVQISPDIRFSGKGWNTNTTTSQEVDWIMSTVPVSGLNGLTGSVRTIRAAVGDEAGVVDMVSSGVFSDGYFRKMRGRAKSEMTRARAITIDELVDEYGKPTHIKIDVEGQEAAALRGGRTTLSESSPILFIELHNEMVAAEGGDPEHTLDELSHLGYDMFSLEGNQFPRDEILKYSIVRIVATRESGR